MLMPTEIVDVHYSPSPDHYDVIVKNFPITQKGKLSWWQKNQILFKNNYKVPIDKSDYGITFWVSDYKEDTGTDQDSDLLCFNDIKRKENCIKKDNRPMKIWYQKDNDLMIFLFNDEDVMYLQNNKTGKMKKFKY